MTDQPQIPPVLALSRVVGGFYADHVQRFGNVTCACSKEEPDQNCDVGVSLAAIAKAEARRYDDGRNRP